jgi:hypothetical protein
MKRKLKLVTSILSFAMSMAFLTLGVYAATARTATITSSITFSSSTIGAKVNVTHALPSSTQPTLSDGTYVTTNVSDPSTTYNSSNQYEGGRTVTITGVSLTETNVWYGIKIVIENTGGRQLIINGVTAAADTLPAAITGLTTNRLESSALTSNAITIAPSETLTLVYTYNVTPTTAPDFTAATGAISIKINLTRHTA